MNPFGDSDERFLLRLRREVEAWEQAGTITAEQGQAILARYPAADSLPGAAARKRQALVVGLSILGAALVGLGIITFFAANWDDIPKSVRLAVLVAGVALSYGAGYYLWQRAGYVGVGVALVLLGCIIFGAGVHLVGQVYHIPVHHPNLTLFWFLGVLPLAYATRSRPVTFLAIVLFLVAAGFRQAHWLGQVSDEEAFLWITAAYLPLGALLYAIGRAKEPFDEWEPMGGLFRAIGLLTVFGALYVLTFHELHENGGGVDGLEYRYWSLTYGAAAISVALLGATEWLRIRRGGLSPLESPVESAELVVIVLLLAASHVAVRVPVEWDALYTVVFNALFALSVLGLMISGYLQEREGRVNLSLGLIALFVISRYFEYSPSLFDRSLVFVGAGVILLAGGFLLERGRRKMLDAMRAGEGER